MTDLQLKTIESYNKTAQNYELTIAQLSNYDHTYDYLADLLNNGNLVLDLACGSAKISRYIAAKKNLQVTGVDLSDEMLEIARMKLPDGIFYKSSIIDFQKEEKYHAVIIGFGLPYLNQEQTVQCLQNAIKLIHDHKYLYISFMQGTGHRVEKTSFGGDNEFLLYYHDAELIKKTLKNTKASIIKEYEIPYTEADGSITKDIIIIAQKDKTL